MDPGTLSVLSGFASTALSGIGSIFSARSQRRENERNRQFNAQQAALARQYNTQMVNAQNQYNSPTETIKRLTDAGVNPALAYANGASLGSVGVGGSASASTGGSVSPPGLDTSGISGMGASASSFADADLKRITSQLTEKEVQYFDQTKEKEFAVSDSIYWSNYQQGNLSLSEREKVAKECANLDETLKLIQNQVDISDSEATIKAIEAFYAHITIPRQSQLVEEIIKETRSKTALNYATIENIGKMFVLSQLATAAQVANLGEQSKVYTQEASKLAQEIKARDPWLGKIFEYDAEQKRLNIQWTPWLNGASVASRAVGAISSFIPGT